MKHLFTLFTTFLIVQYSFGQYGQIGQTFEESKVSNSFDTLKVKVGADFGMQYQNLAQHADSILVPVGRGFNLPEANLNIDAYLARGIRVNLIDYLSSRHHDLGIVKGGFLQIDRLPFINSPELDKIMDYFTIKVGEMEINYGDEHFRRTDNGRLVRNAFIGNYIMDAFTTCPAIEVLFRNNGWLAMAGVGTGTVNQVFSSQVTIPATKTTPAITTYSSWNVLSQLAAYGKIGYDKQITSDFRIRLTLSGYHQGKNQGGGYLYGGDRAGSRYYLVMNRPSSVPANDINSGDNFFSGDFPTAITYNEDNSYLLSLLLRYKGLEFFGTFESATGKTANGSASIGISSNGNGLTGSFNFEQTAVEAIYHFGNLSQFYGGARYDAVKEMDYNLSVDRVQLVLGWYLTPNIVSKIEYVNQIYNNFFGSWLGSNAYGSSAGFKGIMVEAGISF